MHTGPTQLQDYNIKDFLEDFMTTANKMTIYLHLDHKETQHWLQQHHFYFLNLPVLNNIPFNSIDPKATLQPTNYKNIRALQTKSAQLHLDTRKYLYSKHGFNYAACAQVEVEFLKGSHYYTQASALEYMKCLRRLAILATCNKCRTNYIETPVQLGTGVTHYQH